MGAYQQQMLREREEEDRKFREEQHERTLKRMAEMDAAVPSPSIEEIQAAMAPRPIKNRMLKPEEAAPLSETGSNGGDTTNKPNGDNITTTGSTGDPNPNNKNNQGKVKTR